MAKRRGRPRKEGERYANGRLKPVKDTLVPTLVRRMLDDEMKRCNDPRFGSQLGRLVLRGEILAAEYQAGLKFAEIYERTARYNGLKRSAKSPNYEASICGAAERRIGTQVRETADETLEDPTAYEQRTMAADKAYRGLCDLFPSRQRFVLERLCVDDEPLSSSELMTARDGLQKLILHFGTERAPKKSKKPHAKTSVPVVRPAMTKGRAEVDCFTDALQQWLPDRDSLLKAWSAFCAFRDRETYRGQNGYALGVL